MSQPRKDVVPSPGTDHQGDAAMRVFDDIRTLASKARSLADRARRATADSPSGRVLTRSAVPNRDERVRRYQADLKIVSNRS